MRYIDFVQLDYKPAEDDLICSFHVEPLGIPLNEAAGGIAAESSIGTWTELTTDKTYMKELQAKVFKIEGKEIMIAYPIELFELGNMPNILSSISGNVFGLDALRRLRLNEIHLPKRLIESFHGPKYGIDGVRNIIGVMHRPLVGTIIKPKLGLNTFDHSNVAYEAWLGGCDIVKDDENLSNQSFNSFEERVSVTLEKRDRSESETNEKKVYMVNVTAETEEMLKRAEYVEDQGGRYIMIDILTCGWAALQTMRNRDLGLVIHAHRAGHATFTRLADHGINMRVIAKLARAIGVDQLHVGTSVGKMSETKEEVKANITALTEEMHNLKKTLPVASGGLHPSLVPKLVDIFGMDFVIQAGGGIHGHPKGTIAGAKAMRQAVSAAIEGKELEDYAKEHEELALALRTWSVN